MFCPSCTAENSDNASYCGRCGHNLRSAVGRPVDYVPPGSPPPAAAPAHPATGYAGFWRRLAARIIDIIVVALVNIVITTIVGAVAGWEQGANEDRPEPLIIGIFVSWLYYAGMHSSPYQATLGKMALGIVVTGYNGQQIGFWHATGRWLAEIASWLTLLIGFLMAGWTEKKQTLHDILASTLVVNSEQRPAS